MKSSLSLPVLALATLLLAPAARPADQAMSKLAYNNPGLLTDLGVGLWAWPLPMDFNEDGLMDLVVACTDTPSNGIYVFLNTGEVDVTTHLPIFAPARRIGPADRSPQVSYVQGRPLVTTAGKLHPKFKQVGFAEPVALGDPAKIHLEKGNIRANQWKFVDFDGNGALDLVVGIDFWGDYGWDDAWDAQGRWKNGPLRGYVYLLRNRGTNEAPDYAAPEKILTTDGRPVDVFGMPSPSFGDFDHDGDLDLVCGEFLDGFTYFENVGSATAPRYAPGRRLMTGGKPLKMDLCMIAPVAVDFDGDGDLDLVVGDEDGRVAFIENTGVLVDGLPQFLPPRYFRQHAENLKFGALAAPVSIDWDGDGLEDLIVGNTAGYLGFIKNLGGNPVRWAAPVYLAAGGQLVREQAGPNGSIQGPAEAKWGYTNPSVADWDGDGLPDILTNGIWGRVLFYKNIGTRTAPRLAPAQPVEVAWPGATPKPSWVWWQPVGRELVTQWRTTPTVIDWNHDGLPDLVMLDQEGYLACFERRRRPDGQLELLPPQRVFWGEGISAYDGSGRPGNQISGLLRLNERSAGRSGRRTFCFYDWDHDGQLDLLVNSDTNVNVLRGLGRGPDGLWHFKDAGPVHTQLLAAHSTTPTIAHWPGSAVPVLVIGAEDGFFYSLPLSPP
jgi:hypothetical protein